ncbi:MAG: ATP-binding cassette domain-containing protein, partial [Bradyrhizobium sp.]
ALVGRNGSGKSTLLRIVLSELASDTGRIEYPLLEQMGRLRRIKEHIGYVAQRSARWRGRVRENLEFYAAAYGIRGNANIERVTWLLNRFGLVEYEEHTWAQLSGGYQLRFDLARAMLHRPSLLILDEPLANLDVVSQQEFLDDLNIIANSRGSEAAILVTSQHLFEMEAIADQLILLREGQKSFQGDIDALGDARQFNSFEIETEASEQYLRAALQELNIKSVRRFTTHYQLDFPLGVEQAAIMRALSELPVVTSYVRNISRSTRPLMSGLLE